MRLEVIRAGSCRVGNGRQGPTTREASRMAKELITLEAAQVEYGAVAKRELRP